MTRTNRLFALMQALRNRRPPVTAQQLENDTGVSLRTLYRDIDSLRGMGAQYLPETVRKDRNQSDDRQLGRSDGTYTIYPDLV